MKKRNPKLLIIILLNNNLEIVKLKYCHFSLILVWQKSIYFQGKPNEYIRVKDLIYSDLSKQIKKISQYIHFFKLMENPSRYANQNKQLLNKVKKCQMERY